MIPIPSGVRVWIATGHTDMRRGMQSLALAVQESLKRDPHAGDLYIFRGRRGDLVKMGMARRAPALELDVGISDLRSSGVTMHVNTARRDYLFGDGGQIHRTVAHSLLRRVDQDGLALAPATDPLGLVVCRVQRAAVIQTGTPTLLRFARMAATGRSKKRYTQIPMTATMNSVATPNAPRSPRPRSM